MPLWTLALAGCFARRYWEEAWAVFGVLAEAMLWDESRDYAISVDG
jgi:hypothetical protein